MTNKNVPYKLMIVTDSYTGNFERELISFCLGLDEKTAFARPFWDKTVGTGIENIEKYKEFVNKQDNIKMEDDELYYFIIDIKKDYMLMKVYLMKSLKLNVKNLTLI